MTHRTAMIDAIAKLGDITSEQAEKDLAVFIKVKAIKVTAHDGYIVTWGGYMDRDVIRRALQTAA